LYNLKKNEEEKEKQQHRLAIKASRSYVSFFVFFCLFWKTNTRKNKNDYEDSISR